MAASAAAVPTPQLVRSALVLHACASPSIVLYAARLLQRRDAAVLALYVPVRQYLTANTTAAGDDGMTRGHRTVFWLFAGWALI